MLGSDFFLSRPFEQRVSSSTNHLGSCLAVSISPLPLLPTNAFTRRPAAALSYGLGVPSAKCYAYRGASYLGLNLLPAAASEFQIALNLAPDFHQARYWLASTAFLQQDWKRCAVETTKLLQSNPAHEETWLMRCESKRRLGMWKAVVADTTAFLRVAKGKKAECWAAKAEALLNLRKFGDAEIAAGNAINLNPDLMMAFQIRGECRYQLRKYKLSVSDFHEYGKLDRINKKLPFVSPCYAIWHSNRDRPW